MAVLQKGKALYPFWGSSISLITGLDPLGLQNTSEATYATMLPGISNLTNRLRYYGFYSWLLEFYFEKEKKGNSTEQYRFIRRAELMVAILMQSRRKSIQQITGSNFASNLITSKENNYFDLAEGADHDNTDKTVYWKYPSGAFGQYYYGAMKSLALVVTIINDKGDAIYKVSSDHPKQKVSGRNLANAFDKTLTSEIKDLFYDNIKRGRLLDKDIDSLIIFFAIDRIDVKTEEWQLYMDMLLDKDEPGQEVEELFTYHRKETIEDIIRASIDNNNEYNWQIFLLKCYHNKLGSEQNPSTETCIGWYCYQLNEYWQYGCGSIFWATLQHLYNSQQDQYLPHFVMKLSEEVTAYICKRLEGSITPTDPISKLFALYEESEKEEEIFNEIETDPTSDPIAAASLGLLLIFQLCSSNRNFLHSLKEFMNQKQTIREGNMVEALLAIQASANLQLYSFVEQFILRRIIYRHQMVALRKMGNGSQSTYKFLIEDQFIRFIDTFPPRNTSPRMNALQNIMYDLQMITSGNELTILSRKILKN